MTAWNIAFRTRERVEPEHLDADGVLLGGSLRCRIDEEAGIRVNAHRGNRRTVTAHLSEIITTASPPRHRPCRGNERN